MARLLEVHQYGATKVYVFDGWVETVLPDGKVVSAVSHTGPEDVARAHSLGYKGNLWAMTRDHDRLHAALAHMLGLPESPVLRASGTGATSELLGAEECAVLAIQRFWNLCRAQK